jgi:hypothetical protein
VSRSSQDIRKISIKPEFLSIIIVFILACKFLIIYIHLLLYTFIGNKISYILYFIQYPGFASEETTRSDHTCVTDIINFIRVHEHQ